MRVERKITQQIDIKYLDVRAKVRYWEDSEVDGVEDSEGTLMPCRVEEKWCPTIDIETGVIINWEKGKTASVHYKVCDEGGYIFRDVNQHQVDSNDSYVPEILCPKEAGYGDYIIMDIDNEGKIEGWNKELLQSTYNYVMGVEED